MPMRTASNLLQLGYWVVAIHPGQKRPIGEEWGLKRWTEERLRAEFDRHPGAGIGICFGPGRAPKGGWLIDLEGDGSEADRSLLTILGGEAVDTVSWSSVRGKHSLFTADGERLLQALMSAGAVEGKREKKGVWKLAELPGLEWRIGGYKPDGKTVKQVQSVCPPTPGTDGSKRMWVGNPRVGVAALPQSVFAYLGQLVKPIPAPSPAPTATQKRGRPKTDIEARAIAYLDKCDPAISGQRGHDTTFGVACRVGPGFDLSEAATVRLLRDYYNPRCQPEWSEAELEHKVQDAFEKEKRRGWLRDAERERSAPQNGQHDAGRNGEPPNGPIIARDEGRYHQTDTGNAERMADRFRDRMRHCHPWGKWLIWDGRRWAVDDTAALNRMATETTRNILAEAATIADKRERKWLVKWALASESRRSVNAMIGLAAAREGIPILPIDMDRDGWLLNLRNGTLDLRTGGLRPHQSDDLITRMCPVDFDPDAACPTWDWTLDGVFDGRSDLIEFVRRLFGMCLTADATEQVLPIFHGKGSNGKSTLLGAILEILGDDYAITAPPGLLVQRYNDPHPTERAILFGKRLVVDMESAEGAKLNETMVKQLTGSDRISARKMREDFWDFAPTHKIIMGTNHKPTIKGTDHAIWRRIKLVPFTVEIPESDQIKNLPQRLRLEYPGILNWCFAGCLDWQRNGLNPPDAIVASTSEYRSEQDLLAEFIAEECVIGENYRDKASRLYDHYRCVNIRRGEESMNQKRFGQSLAERGFERYENHGIWYRGIGLRPKSSDESFLET